MLAVIVDLYQCNNIVKYYYFIKFTIYYYLLKFIYAKCTLIKHNFFLWSSLLKYNLI